MPNTFSTPHARSAATLQKLRQSLRQRVGLLTDPSHALMVSTKTYTVVRSGQHTFTFGAKRVIFTGLSRQSKKGRIMQHEPFEVEVDAAIIQEVDQALRALRMPQDKLTVSMLFLVGFTCGQAGWPIKRVLAYVEPILKEGLKRGEEVRARLAREQGRPSS
jgi:hypothetical protein